MNVREILEALRGGPPTECSFCGRRSDNPADFEPEEAGDWVCADECRVVVLVGGPEDGKRLRKSQIRSPYYRVVVTDEPLYYERPRTTEEGGEILTYTYFATLGWQIVMALEGMNRDEVLARLAMGYRRC